ncbi:ubiquinone-binding protein [Rhodothalassium salexigens]|uniref:Coenzyme Q-binding protein COQ10 n=1 Tax=Rhodothalassium salexigens DSM 2132 TaxID=1188247 RepID=A0A4R2PVN0_RHOSA|nr:type II toxin-antitoxin system RatA family toxin [Rhodothalassium salexigens]MBB4210100.1 coenzyme Q-binding protein COQ10 [Rhodothalassium salexigens DSM 2132]MBK1638424.1 ubiquinone-binding protein [Rhodothalassium salexigens DSM 2132]MBK5911093.1 ubiquinone-binding protein [Rhodothalassium salexigens]MBK5922091.1 ubiquinone-binding protein [Rhodothalassium salexigens]TCP38265.1 coenzyme Q-binding protein COQ10 [Rhodothalassium salexigens DSM 2132]
MPRHRERRVLPHTPEQLFDLVSDVENYPDFVPWVAGVRMLDRRDDLIVADLVVGFRMIRESFRSRVTLERPHHVHVDYVRGPLKYLYNDWRFRPVDGGTEIDFEVDFQFKSKMFERLAGALFTEAVQRMVSAFEREARRRYGRNSISSAT